MSVIDHIPSLGKLYPFYEKIPEVTLDETDVDIYFYTNIFDNSQAQHPRVRVSKVSNKKSFTFNLFEFCSVNKQQPHIPQHKVKIPEKELSSLVDKLHDFLEASF